MGLSTKELLKPRIKCIAPYPYAIYKVGDVILFNSEEDSKPIIGTYDNIENVKSLHYVSFQSFLEFSILFENLPWYAERKVEDMPEYVKDDKGFVFKQFHTGLDFFGIKGQSGWRYKFECVPSDETEYTNYINSKNK
jgi:hypothetical protein